jgi:hypothetical protein
MNKPLIRETQTRFVVPAKAGIQPVSKIDYHQLDPGVCRGDGQQ